MILTIVRCAHRIDEFLAVCYGLLLDSVYSHTHRSKHSSVINAFKRGEVDGDTYIDI